MEVKIVKLAGGKEKISRKVIEAEFGISQTMSGRLLKNMVDKEILRSVGKGKNTVYVLNRQ